jgi:hypothetical protein
MQERLVGRDTPVPGAADKGEELARSEMVRQFGKWRGYPPEQFVSSDSRENNSVSSFSHATLELSRLM